MANMVSSGTSNTKIVRETRELIRTLVNVANEDQALMASLIEAIKELSDK